MTLLLALLIGVVAGLRALAAPAAVAFAARFGNLNLGGTPLAFLGYMWTPWVLGLLAVGELITDQLPSTPSRKVPVQFVARVVLGAVSGGAIGVSNGMLIIGLLAGGVGAVIGTLGGAALRARLAAAFGRDRPAAIIEDIIAIGGAILIVGCAA